MRTFCVPRSFNPHSWMVRRRFCDHISPYLLKVVRQTSRRCFQLSTNWKRSYISVNIKFSSGKEKVNLLVTFWIASSQRLHLTKFWSFQESKEVSGLGYRDLSHSEAHLNHHKLITYKCAHIRTISRYKNGMLLLVLNRVLTQTHFQNWSLKVFSKLKPNCAHTQISFNALHSSFYVEALSNLHEKVQCSTSQGTTFLTWAFYFSHWTGTDSRTWWNIIWGLVRILVTAYYNKPQLKKISQLETQFGKQKAILHFRFWCWDCSGLHVETVQKFTWKETKK